MNDSANKNKRKKGLLACCLVAPALLVSLTLSVCVCVFLVNSCSRVIQENKLKSEEAKAKAHVENWIIKNSRAKDPSAQPSDSDWSGWETVKDGTLVFRSIEHEKRNEGIGYTLYGPGNRWTIAGSFETENHQAEFFVEIEMDKHSSIIKESNQVEFENGSCWNATSELLKEF